MVLVYIDDELEKRIKQHMKDWGITGTSVGGMVIAFVDDVLPPLNEGVKYE